MKIINQEDLSASSHLLIIILLSIVNNIEESQLIDTLAGRNHSEPISQLLFLEEFLRQVLEITTRELGMSNNLNLAITNLADLDDLAEVSDSSVDLDLILEELLEGGDVEDLVACGLGGVDDEFMGNLGMLALGRFLHTQKVLASQSSLLYHASICPHVPVFEQQFYP